MQTLRKKITGLFFITITLLCTISARSQKGVSCQQKFEESKKAAKAEQFEDAINKFRAARNCGGKYQDSVDQELTKVFKAINERKNQAEREAFKSKMQALASAALALRYDNPTKSLQLASYAYSNYPSAATQQALAELSSDSTISFYQVLNHRLTGKTAINDSLHTIVYSGVSPLQKNLPLSLSGCRILGIAPMVFVPAEDLNKDGTIFFCATSKRELFLTHPLINRSRSVTLLEAVPDRLYLATPGEHNKTQLDENYESPYDCFLYYWRILGFIYPKHLPRPN